MPNSSLALSFFFFIFFYFTILYWFCHTSTCICHRCTRVPHPEPPSHLPPHTIPLGHPSAPAPSILYHALKLDWRFVSYMILYMFQCHSPRINDFNTDRKLLFCVSLEEGHDYFLLEEMVYDIFLVHFFHSAKEEN